MSINKVAVIGAGTMGSSIATALIGSGYQVLLKDVSVEAVNIGLMKIDRFLESKIKKGLSPEDAEKQRKLVTATVDYSQFADVDLVIEAVLEKIEVKEAVFKELDAACSAKAILASNTSSLPITQIAGFSKHPERIIGLHFFNPAHLMKLVEVVPGLQTSPDTVQAALDFGKSLGKLAIRVEECASFLVNRLLGRYMNESIWCLQEGVPVEVVDQAACDYAMPIGPLALRDMNGADIGLAVASFNYQEYGERFAPPPFLQMMVAEQLLGQKTGEGFYLYDPHSRKRTAANPRISQLMKDIPQPKDGLTKDDFKAERLFLPMINEAFLALQEKICHAEDLDAALRAGLGMRKGPLELAADMGLADCLQKLESYSQVYPERFRPAALLKRYVWAGRKAVI